MRLCIVAGYSPRKVQRELKRKMSANSGVQEGCWRSRLTPISFGGRQITSVRVPSTGDKIIRDAEGKILGRIENEEPAGYSGGRSDPPGLGFLLFQAPADAALAWFAIWLVAGAVLGYLVTVVNQHLPSYVHDPFRAYRTTFKWSSYAGRLVGACTLIGLWFYAFSDPRARASMGGQAIAIVVIIALIALVFAAIKILAYFVQ